MRRTNPRRASGVTGSGFDVCWKNSTSHPRRTKVVQKTKKIWMDGRLVDWDDARIHVLTHTLHYGVGAFEGIRCYKTGEGAPAVFRLKEHVDRLFASAHILTLDIPY